MGCHTWFYRKIEKQPSYEECKSAVIHKIQKGIAYYAKLLNSQDLDEDDKLIIKTNQLDAHTLNEIIKESQDELNDVIQDKDPDHTMSYYANSCMKGLCKYHNGFFYTNDPDEDGNRLPHNIFRVSNYPEDVLASYDEFEKFYETHDCYFYDDITEERSHEKSELVKLKMMEFWEEYPDGIVEFG